MIIGPRKFTRWHSVKPSLRPIGASSAFPLCGNGGTRLQPVYVEDIGEAVARIMRLPATERIYELAGPQAAFDLVVGERSLQVLVQGTERAVRRRHCSTPSCSEPKPAACAP
jgi:nucleoside-diphosphate-sugar epimerase